jgi:hypothetical protein
VIQPSYDQVAQEALTPGSKVNSSRPDVVFFALDCRALPLKLSLGNSEASAATVEGVIGYLRALRDGIKVNSDAVCIFQSFAAPVERPSVLRTGMIRNFGTWPSFPFRTNLFHSTQIILPVLLPLFGAKVEKSWSST